MEQSMRLIPRLTMSYFQKENCDANLRLFCKLFPNLFDILVDENTHRNFNDVLYRLGDNLHAFL